jgi:hypothetical protein
MDRLPEFGHIGGVADMTAQQSARPMRQTQVFAIETFRLERSVP